jgi:Ca2+-transporting ATPase
MAGDGVNDAPALKGANIGIAVGSGTAVAKETADLILLDDSFSTIVAAIEEGRRIYKNIKKVILYLLSGSFAEIVLIIASIIFKLPLPLLPAQILWVNIIQETFPTIALAFDKGEKENMKERPRRNNLKLIDKEMKLMIVTISLVANALLFGLFVLINQMTRDIDQSRTLTFAGLTIASLFYIYAIRSERFHLWERNPFDNWYLNAAVLFGCLLFLGAIYLPPLQTILHTVQLNALEWFLLGIFGIVNIGIIEIIKMFFIKKISPV